MKKCIAAFGCAAVLLCLAGCTPHVSTDPNHDPVSDAPVEISLWTYPIGGWNKSGTISSLLAGFRREHKNITVNVHTVTYETGDSEIEAAIAADNAPDIVLEGPERLVAGWGARGLMADLSELWENPVSQEIKDENVRTACRDQQGHSYIYPMCMTTHCMAINRDLFEETGAWKYVDEATHTWTTDGFVKAVETLYEHGVEHVAAIYCGGQGGDQGTRALVNNLYGGRFTDPQHSKFTVDSAENIAALELLKSMKGISFDSSLVGSTEITKFVSGELAMSLCWNVSMEVTQVTQNPGIGFDIFPMAFPTNQEKPALQGGIWGFGAFDNGDEARLKAAKTFIRYMTQEDESYERAVFASAYWPVRDMPDLYINDTLMSEYSIFSQYFGDFYQVTPGWTEARTAWWEMLKKIGEGQDVSEAVREFSVTANAKS